MKDAITSQEFALCAELEKNIGDEAEARYGYYILLTKFGHLLTSDELKVFEEIIAEELNEAKKNDSVFSEDFLSFTESDSLSTISKRIYDFTV